MVSTANCGIMELCQKNFKFNNKKRRKIEPENKNISCGRWRNQSEDIHVDKRKFNYFIFRLAPIPPTSLCGVL